MGGGSQPQKKARELSISVSPVFLAVGLHVGWKPATNTAHAAHQRPRLTVVQMGMGGGEEATRHR